MMGFLASYVRLREGILKIADLFVIVYASHTIPAKDEFVTTSMYHPIGIHRNPAIEQGEIFQPFFAFWIWYVFQLSNVCPYVDRKTPSRKKPGLGHNF